MNEIKNKQDPPIEEEIRSLEKQSLRTWYLLSSVCAFSIVGLILAISPLFRDNITNNFPWADTNRILLIGFGGSNLLLILYMTLSQMRISKMRRRLQVKTIESATRQRLDSHQMDALRQASMAKSEFLANMSHEIRTPMTAILGFAELLEDPTIQDEEKADYIHTLKTNGHYLQSIINDILDISKIESGRLEIEKSSFSVMDVAEEIISQMAIQAREQGTDLGTFFEFPLPVQVTSDKVRLRQILINLVGNAIKFTEFGEVTLKVSFRHTDEADWIDFSIRDTGIGIPPEQLERLFEPFTQVDASTSRRYEGTGLGLAISKRLAEMLGGNISVQSEVGKGSAFHLSINAGNLDGVRMIERKSGAGRSRPRIESKEIVSEKLSGSVLVAEDNLFLQKLTRRFLSMAGLTTHIANNGAEAYEMVLKAEKSGTPYDLILMDMMMPEVNGLEATVNLREKGFTLPIVALTANAMVEDREKCLAAGCNGFVTKPFDKEKLMKMVKPILEGVKESLPA